MDLMAVLRDDDLLLRLVCLLVVLGFVVVAIIKAFRGDDL